MKHPSLRLLWCAAALLLTVSPCAAQKFLQKNLVSDIPGLAKFTDPDLKNPWGITSSATSPFWISDEVTGKSTIYNGAGVKQGLVVDVVGGHPTGTFFNGTSSFGGDRFLFATLNGTIAGWQPASGTTAVIRVDSSGKGAVYTGLASGNNGTEDLIYAADSANNVIDVFRSDFSDASFGASAFTDPNLGAGFSVYNIQNLAGTLFVTYENETTGGGVIDAFDLNGTLLRRVSANPDGGPLDSPWGLAVAPSSFGKFSGALLVGNEDDGHINAFDSGTGAFLGTLKDVNGNPLSNEGLWGLQVGNGGNGGDPNKLYFAAGIQGEQHGLFGSIQSVPEFSSAVSLGSMILVAMGLSLRRRREI